MSRRPSGAPGPSHVASYGPSVAALIVTVTVFSFAGAFALAGVPDSETGLFYLMGEVAGVDLGGVTVVSAGWLLVARLAGLGMLASAVGIIWTKRRLGRPGEPT